MELQLVVVMKDQLLLCQAMESDPGQQLYESLGLLVTILELSTWGMPKPCNSGYFMVF